ncbi:MAG: asparagine synthase (glutamine-hydrolyzing) [Deltaproteobacteria bacterium]|nr:asparagine synthase (glutamine-hydrolyzing) [Deltaproteobacteria bacterium]
MCGICGKLDFTSDSISEELLRSMTRTFPYRGPDDEGIYCKPPVGLGHRRLSIIDLSPAGHQPMSNEDGNVWFIFNGEIYDFEIIRQELLSRGHIFKSRTDCEVVIHLYEEEGIDCIKRLNGMFAFALWDESRNQLFLARDRLGIKPLHYFWNGKALIFGSEIKAILLDPVVPRIIDHEALELYLTLNYIPAPLSIFKHIQKLPPASYLQAGTDGMSVRPYWDIGDNTEEHEIMPHGGNLEEYKRHLFELLESAVKRRLIADVPLGAFLSGGIDSSIIVALMARNSKKTVKTFSIGYRDLPSFDETAYAREVAALNNTDHYEFKLGYRDIIDAFPSVLENLDEPFADSSAVPTYIVSRETKDHVTVALSGDGGDELFAGYRMYQGEYWAKFYLSIPEIIRKRLIIPLVNAFPDSRDTPGLELIRRMKKFANGVSGSFPERFYAWREIYPFSLRRRLLLDPPVLNNYLNYIRKQAASESVRFHGDMINLMLYMDVKTLLPNDMLTKVDRMSMANSLEVRVPFLDHTVSEYAFNLKGDLKLKGRRGKYILTETFKGLLPPSVHNRPKRGFEMPIGAWLRKELKFLIDDYLVRDKIRKQGIFDFDIINELVDMHMRGRQDTSWQLWNLIVFQYWHMKYL